MAPVSEQPTQVRPTVPPPGHTPGLTPRDPRSLSPGGPGEPPRPPRRTGGGGGGGGGFGGSDDPRGEGEPRRTGLFVLLGAGVVLVLVVLALVLNGGDDNDGRVAPANQQSTRFAEDTTPSPSPSPEATASPKATPTPSASPKAVDDSAKATTPQDETGGVAVGGGGQTGDAADAADAEAEANAPLLQAGSVAKLTFKQGDTIRFRVTSPTAQEVHVHGYDRSIDVAAGETKTVAFPATLTGIYDVEFEGTGTKIAELTVEP